MIKVLREPGAVALARFLGVTKQRALKLLADGCVQGAKKDARGVWVVLPWPPRIRPGGRGPRGVGRLDK